MITTEENELVCWPSRLFSVKANVQDIAFQGGVERNFNHPILVQSPRIESAWLVDRLRYHDEPTLGDQFHARK